MQAFEFYCPTKIYFGKGAEAKVGEAVKHFGGTKVFIVYGGHSAVKSGLIARIEQTLTDAGLEHMSFGGVQPNPRLSHAREGVQKALAFGADFILGVNHIAARLLFHFVNAVAQILIMAVEICVGARREDAPEDLLNELPFLRCRAVEKVVVQAQYLL